MLTYIFIIFFVTMLVKVYKYDIGIGIVATIIGGTLGCMLIMAVNVFFCGFWPHEHSRVDIKQPIRSLNIGNEMTGSFFLGSGSINNEASYYFYTEDKDGFLTLKSVPVKHSRIKETDDMKPHTHKQIAELENNSWVVPSFLTIRQKIFTDTDIYIPKGSIIQQYNPNP